jgi:NTP pyrophosphatase (non-canonical NTP hydrolase)
LIKEELGDVANYCVLMAYTCGLDLDETIQTKICSNNENILLRSHTEAVKI